MVIVDTALAKRQEEKNPIRVGLVGAGFMGKGTALQILKYTQGMDLVAICNRTADKAGKAYEQAGVTDYKTVSKLSDLEDNIKAGKYSITDNPDLIADAEGIDVVLEITGSIEYAANLIVRAIKNKKHVVQMNAEVDGTLGPYLKTLADEYGVVYTFSDGDQPGVEMNLYRYVQSMGVKPICCGNIKGLHDPYRNPTTQEGFAKKWGQNPYLVTSFADGTKISFEQAIVANGTGMTVARPAMLGPTVPSGTPLRECFNDIYPLDEFAAKGGVVDYVVGAEPGPGIYVIGTFDDPVQAHYLNLYKMGEGPYYCFYTPWHLCHFEVPRSIARAALFHDATLAPAGKPMVDVVAVAKTDLKAGEQIDRLGGYSYYGICVNYDESLKAGYLPAGIAEDCVLKRDMKKDEILTYGDVIIPDGRISDILRAKQNELFF